MISFLKGKIIIKKEDFLVLDVNGVGYKVFAAKKLLSGHKKGDLLELFCFLNVRENGLELYGFSSEEELEFFEVLKNIRGIGARAALKIISLGPIKETKKRIISQDEKIFEGVSGIGRKKAMAVILELSGKLKENLFEKKNKLKDEQTNEDEVEEALINLGFSRQKAKQAIGAVSKEVKSPEERIKQALKILGAQIK